jgi:hypothetical protein
MCGVGVHTVFTRGVRSAVVTDLSTVKRAAQPTGVTDRVTTDRPFSRYVVQLRFGIREHSSSKEEGQGRHTSICMTVSSTLAQSFDCDP